MRKIAVALAKGGVGKTTTAVNLAAGLALQNKHVALIDVDTQGQSGRSLAAQPNPGLAELAAGEAGLDQVLQQVRPNLCLIAGGRSLGGLKQWIARKDFGGEMTLDETLAPLDGRFDFVILDTSPGWDPLAVNALFYVDEVLAPVSLEVMTLQSLLEFNHTLSTIQRYRPKLSLRYILPTFYDRRVRKSEEILEQLRTHYGELVCQPVRYNVRLSESPGYGQSIFEYAPSSAGAEDYQQLVKRIAQDG